jgi:hypothetical protein
MLRRPVLALAMGLGLAAAGCPDSSSTGIGFSAATLVAVVPADFLGSVPCAEADGAARSWVARLEDVTDGVGSDGEGFELRSGSGASCRGTATSRTSTCTSTPRATSSRPARAAG